MNMSKKNNNHFVSVGLAQNFRVCGSNMWRLNCKTGEISDRHTSPGKLFMGKRLWSREVEDAYMELENRLLPLIKQILGAPYADIPPNFTGQVVELSKNYLPIFGYIMQSFMLQRANTPEAKGKDEKYSQRCYLAMYLPRLTQYFLSDIIPNNLKRRLYY